MTTTPLVLGLQPQLWMPTPRSLTGEPGSSDDDDDDGPGSAKRATLKALGIDVSETTATTSAEKASIASTVPKGDGLPAPGSSMRQPSSLRGVKQKQEAENAMEENAMAQVGKQPSKRARKKRGIKSTPLGIAVIAINHQQSLEFPEWGGHRGFCGSSGHLFFQGGDVYLCPHAKRRILADGATMSLTSVCTYSKCSIGHLHIVRVCPVLHHLWGHCGLCGHNIQY